MHIAKYCLIRFQFPVREMRYSNSTLTFFQKLLTFVLVNLTNHKPESVLAPCPFHSSAACPGILALTLPFLVSLSERSRYLSAFPFLLYLVSIPLCLRPHKKGQWALHVYSIANFVVSWLKWLQMSMYVSKKSTEIIWSHF